MTVLAKLPTTLFAIVGGFIIIELALAWLIGHALKRAGDRWMA